MKWFKSYLLSYQHIAPLVTFRILFGSIMFFSIVRFLLNGWVNDQYIEPQFYFTFYGFDWVQPLGSIGMYTLFALMGIGFLCIALGWYYRIAVITTFICFTYVELIDKTNYLNHYYFISIVTFLLIFVPANRYFSLDTWRKPHIKLLNVPKWTIHIFLLQLGMVYFFAGFAKLNTDWLFHAMPLKIWLAAHMDFPLIGQFFNETWVAYLFSWFGAIYDLSIPFLLCFRVTRKPAYAMVVFFHLMTAMLFPIGMFPYIMILSTLLFFPVEFHQKCLRKLSFFNSNSSLENPASTSGLFRFQRHIPYVLIIFFVVQLLVPFRYLLYPGSVFWTEEGYRFSWRVMLMEKAGYATFHVEDPDTGRKWEVKNYDFLTPNQEKMMSTQPDMILQFAHFLKNKYVQSGIKNPQIKVENYVTLNGRKSQLLINPTIDLTTENESFNHKHWILPFNDEI